jgi:hypothetical protein
MTAVLQNVAVEQGSTMSLQFGPVLDDFGSPVDLGGATGKWAMGKRYDGSAFINKSSADGSITFYTQIWYNVTQWYVSVQLDASDTLNAPPSIPPVHWYHQLQVTTRDGNVATIASGQFDLIATIIHTTYQVNETISMDGISGVNADATKL